MKTCIIACPAQHYYEKKNMCNKTYLSYWSLCWFDRKEMHIRRNIKGANE